MNDEVKKIVEYCQKHLNLSNATLPDEYFYNSLPFCVIDSIFSIGANYRSVRNVVVRYCDHFKLTRIRENEIPPMKEQESINNFCEKFEKFGLSLFVNNIFINKQRTSSKNGILKAQAVYEFCEVLKNYDVNYLQDVKKIVLNKKFEEEIKKIKGQSSGISLRYFFMLAGSDDFIKPDRMILRFLKKILGRTVGSEESQKLLEKTADILTETYSHINPRLIDHQIWTLERSR